MASRFFGTGASLVFLVSALLSKPLLNGPLERLEEDSAKANDPVGAKLVGTEGSPSMSFLGSSLDKLNIKPADFHSEELPAGNAFSDFVVELTPQSTTVNAMNASFARALPAIPSIDLSESLFGDYPLENSKPAKTEAKGSKDTKSEKTKKGLKDSFDARDSQSVESSTGVSEQAVPRSSIGNGVGSSGTDGVGLTASNGSGGVGGLQRSNGNAVRSGRSAGNAGFAGGLGGARSTNGGGGSAMGSSGGGAGGSFPSIGGGGGGANTGASNQAVVSSVDRVLATRSENASTNIANNASNRLSSAIVSSERPKLTADGKYGIPNHQYWTYNFDEDSNSNGVRNEKADADLQFNSYLSNLTGLLKDFDQVVKFSPTELSSIYSDLNRQVSDDPVKSQSFLTFMIIDFPVKGFYLPRDRIPTSPGDPGIP